MSIESVSVASVMTKGIKTAKEGQTVKTVAKQMIDNNIGSVVIVKNGGLPSGIITEKDIVKVAGRTQLSTLDMPASEIMSKPVITINAQSSLKDAIQTMQLKNIRRLPVVVGGKMTGIITDSDIFRAIMKSQSLITTVSESVLIEYKPVYDRLAEVMLGEILLPGDR